MSRQFSNSVYVGILLLLSLSASLLIHILIMMRYYRPGFLTVSLLTAGMFLAWFHTSNRIKLLADHFPADNPWKRFVSSSPDLLKFIVGFIILYALINLFISMRAASGPGLFNTDIPYYKLRGLSGFWMAFFALASLVQLTVNRQIMLQNPDENERDNR